MSDAALARAQGTAKRARTDAVRTGGDGANSPLAGKAAGFAPSTPAVHVRSTPPSASVQRRGVEPAAVRAPALTGSRRPALPARAPVLRGRPSPAALRSLGVAGPSIFSLLRGPRPGLGFKLPHGVVSEPQPTSAAQPSEARRLWMVDMRYVSLAHGRRAAVRLGSAVMWTVAVAACAAPASAAMYVAVALAVAFVESGDEPAVTGTAIN